MNALLYIPGIFTSTDPHKYAYISKRINPIIIISSDLDSTINFALERHVFGKSQFSPFFFVLKGLCPLNIYLVTIGWKWAGDELQASNIFLMTSIIFSGKTKLFKYVILIYS